MDTRVRSTIVAWVVATALLGGSAIAQQTVLFSDDFEHGSSGWDLDRGWSIVPEGSNHVLSGTGGAWATVKRGAELGTIAGFRHRFKLVRGEAHINFRANELTRTSRYWVNLAEGSLALVKMTAIPNPSPGQDPFVVKGLANVPAPVALGIWQTLEVTGDGGHLEVFLDGTRYIDVTDTDSPHVGGTVSFECGVGIALVIDDLVLWGQPPSGPRWVATGGPRGGIGYDIRIDPRDANTMWVTDAFAGAYRSGDGGRTWAPRNTGITARSGSSGDGIPIFSLNLDPSDPDTLWAGTQGMRGVFRSVDGGGSWVEMDDGIVTQPSMEMRSFTVDPHSSKVAYCGGNYMADAATLRQRGFIYKTTDGGTTWRLLAEPGALVRWIIVDPGDSKVVYAATGIFDRFAVKAEGVLKSTDGGATWQNVNQGLVSLVVGALVMDPSDPKVLIAGCGGGWEIDSDPTDLLGGVFKSKDGGATWRKVDPFGIGSRAQVTAVGYAPSDPRIVYADTGHIVLRSTDGGDTWEWFSADAQGESRGNPISLAVHPNDPDTVFMNAYGGGVFVSHDGGHTWADSSRGVSGAGVWGIAVDPRAPSSVVAASKNGVYLSEDSGTTWIGRSADGVDNMLSIAVDPTVPGTWLAGRLIDGHLWRTTDGGVTWQSVLGPIGEDTMFGGRRSIHQIVFAPSDPTKVYAATGIATGYVSYETRGTGVFLSTDGGTTWSARNAGLEATTQNAAAVAVDPHDAATAYIGLLDKGVYKTTDRALSWLPANQGLAAGEIRSVAIDPFDPHAVLAGAERGGVWRSLDGGASWKLSSSGMPPEATVRSIVFDPAHSGVVYAGDLSSGVYRSSDHGVTWALMNHGLLNRAVDALALTPDGRHLFAATEGGGVFRLDLPVAGTIRRRLVWR